MSNEVPQLFDWDQVKNQPADRWGRLELNHATVDFVAPTEYMVSFPFFIFPPSTYAPIRSALLNHQSMYS